MEEKIRPSKIWFIVPIFIFIFIFIFMGIFVLYCLFVLSKVVDEPDRYITMPSETIIEIEDYGKYGIYYVYTDSYQLNEDIVFYFENTETGEVFESEYVYSYTYYDFFGIHGDLTARVVLPDEGKYSVTSNYINEDIELIFKIGQNIVPAPFTRIFTIVFGSILALITIFISIAITIYLRQNSKERLRKKLEHEKTFPQN